MLSPLSMMIFIGDAATTFSPNADDLTVVLLVLVFGMAVGVGLACLFIVLRTVRHRPRVLLSPILLPAVRNRPIPGPPPQWTPLVPGRWLAIAGSNLVAVRHALGIDHATPCSWADGLMVAGQQMVFLTPPQQGWILVFGAVLPDPAMDVDQCFLRLTALSRELGRVQFFSFDCTLRQHAWAMLDRGRVVRAYAWAGQTLWNQGAMTQAERECGLTCLEYAAGNDTAVGLQLGRMMHNAEHVSELAGRWGIHPATVAERMGRDGQGVAGEISRSKAH